MKRIRTLPPRTFCSLLSLVTLVGCASEGGVTGTGISGIVAGHVTLADGSSPATLEVSIDGRQAPIDASGNFELTGEFSGPTVLSISPIGGSEAIGSLQVALPAGATTVMEEIHVDALAAEPVRLTVARHGSVIGRIQSVSCFSNTGIAIELGNGNTFSFLLSEEVVIRDRQRLPLVCEDLRRGDRIEATGVQLADGTSIATSIELSDRPAAPVDEFTVEFGGSANNVFCDEYRLRILVLTDADPFLTSARGRPRTELFCVDANGPRPCACEDISVRDIVQVRGAVTVAHPDAVTAESIYVFPGPALAEAPVVVRRVGCARRRIETEAFFANTSQVVIARFDETTRFLCEGVPCRCEDLRRDDVVRLFGSPIVANGRPFVDALEIARE